jgi:REP element-mobilizing transposase RayT
MARKARKHTIDPSVIQVVHVWNRCIRRLALCGLDPVTGVDHEYRRGWSRERLRYLAQIYAIEILTYAVLHNHTHIVVRSRPDIARQWTPQMVAQRWLMLTPTKDAAGNIIEPSAKQVQAITDDPELVEKLRLQLSDISWLMRSYSQHIAFRANREDRELGHFWQDRYKAFVLVDQAAILRCMMYVDLNLIRAGLANSIQDSDYTGAKDRLDDLRIHVATNDENQITLQFSSNSSTAAWERLEHQCSGWLSPIEIDAQLSEAARETEGSLACEPSQRPTRVSQRGAVRIPLTKYLLLLDLIGRQQRAGGSGFIPNEVVPILEQLNIELMGFGESIWYFGRRFKMSACKQSNGKQSNESLARQLQDSSTTVAV